MKGFSVVNDTEIDLFLEFPCFLYDPVDVGNMISGSSAFSKPSKVMLKILHSRLQQHVNQELLDVQAGFRKAEEPEIILPTFVGL